MHENRLVKSTRNMIFSFIYQTLSLILSFVSRTVFIHVLGNEYLGLNGIFSDILNLLSMADLGFGTAMAYSFYKPLADRDEYKLAALTTFYKRIYHIIAISVTVVGLALLPYLRFIVNTTEDIPLLELYYLFALANVVISYLFVYKTTILTADQKNYELVKITMWTSILKTILQIVTLFMLGNYILYLFLGILFQILNNIIASKKTERLYPFIKKNEKLKRDEQIDIFKSIKSVFIYKVSGTIFNATDNLLISMLISTAAVGIYSNYIMISAKLLLLLQIIFSALTASIGNIMAKEKADKQYEIFNAAQSISFILCGIITCVYCVTINDLILVWLGTGFMVTIETVMAITLNTYLSCILQPLWTYRDASGIYLKTKYVMLLAAIINIVLSIIMGKLLGIAGIVFASAIARMSTYFWYEPKILFSQYFKKSVKKYYMSIFTNIVLVLFMIFVLSKVFMKYEVKDWYSLIVKGLSSGIICLVFFLLVYCKTEGFKIILAKSKIILRKIKK